jgi:hypothetical protein
VWTPHTHTHTHTHNLRIYRAYTKEWCGINSLLVETAPLFCVYPVLYNRTHAKKMCSLEMGYNSVIIIIIITIF